MAQSHDGRSVTHRGRATATVVSPLKTQAAISRHPVRACLIITILILVAAQPVVFAAKQQPWIELRSPNFIVVTNANETQARHLLYQFEMVRAVFREFLGTSGSLKDQPVIIIAAKDEATLKTLVPEYWAKKGLAHPAGIYFGGPEKNYIALRLDVSMDQSAFEAYEPVYHEYVHYLTRRYIAQMPLWLVEGLAEFYGTIRTEGKSVFLGAPSSSNLTVLRQDPPLLLSTLFDINRSSPYYHEQNKTSIFYAESWALTHYLITRDWREKTHRVSDFIVLTGQNVPQAEAARRTIGDPEALDGALSQYIRNVAFTANRLDAPAVDVSDFRVQPISDAESLAMRADFMVHDRHYAEAEEMLQESLKLDPKLAAACESMGFLYFQQGKREEAGKWYSKAVALNSQSYYVNYYYAENLLTGNLDEDSAAKAELSLRAAIKLNPDFVLAYSALANLLLQTSPARHQKPEEAYMLVVRLIELEPGDVYHRILAVQVLERLGRSEDAVRVAKLALSLAKTPQDQAEASAALSSAQQFGGVYHTREEPRKTQVPGESSGQTTETIPISTELPPKLQRSRTVCSDHQDSGPVEILSDTMGVDFGAYLKEVVDDVRKHWCGVIPEAALPPLRKKGNVQIQFAIQKDGSVSRMALADGSGDAALDRAAWNGITSSNPFRPLPTEFGGEYILLRFHFFYNPSKE